MAVIKTDDNMECAVAERGGFKTRMDADGKDMNNLWCSEFRLNGGCNVVPRGCVLKGWVKGRKPRDVRRN